MRRAVQAARDAYAPYSRFRVGAAVLGAAGIYIGTNVENASYGLTLCAERSALAAAVAAGDRRIGAVALACIDARAETGIQGLLPCGACRQWLAELAPQSTLFIYRQEQTFTPAQLLPLAFDIQPDPPPSSDKSS